MSKVKPEDRKRAVLNRMVDSLGEQVKSLQGEHHGR